MYKTQQVVLRNINVGETDAKEYMRMQKDVCQMSIKKKSNRKVEYKTPNRKPLYQEPYKA